MASGIAHDINNALSPILAFSEMLLRKEPELTDNGRKHLEHIRTASVDIAQIVTRMSEFHRRREHRDELHVVPVSRLIQQIIELTSPCWQALAQGRGNGIEIQTHFEDALPELYCNQSEVREALTNIVLNAVDALPNGGWIRLSARAVSLAGTSEPAVKPTHVIIEVTDNGVGMDEATRQRCLEPFFSTKRQRGGTGLGLAMVYGVMERHEGQIEVQSELHKGTTIRLVFPVREPSEPRLATAAAPSENTAHLRLLCIDDEPLLRELLKEVLEFNRHEVQTADGGRAGVELFQKAQASGRPFDVVITDLGMPEFNGRQVAERIKADSPGTPVIMLTGWGTMLEEREEAVSKVDLLLSKPPRVNELVEALSKVTGLQAGRDTSFFQRA
jgi:CheY-like chemotaxis protein